MLRLPSILHAVLLAALASAAVQCGHILALQDLSITTRLQQFSYQGRTDAVHIIEDAVVIGPASAAVQAAFDHGARVAASFPLRRLLHQGNHSSSLLPQCNRCALYVQVGSYFHGHCKSKSKVFNCATRRRVSVAPGEEASIIEAPVTEVPGEEAPVKEAPGKEAPVNEPPIKEA